MSKPDREYDFDERKQFSMGRRRENDIATIMFLLKGCVSVEKTNLQTDRTGIDYFAHLRKGSRVAIDAKARESGCSRFWRNGPEVALETWSVCPNGKYRTPPARAVTGWTLSESSQTQYVLFTFDSADCELAYLVPFQLLRVAFRTHHVEWVGDEQHTGCFRVCKQDSKSWESECVFVPITTVLEAIRVVSRGPLVEVAAPDTLDFNQKSLIEQLHQWQEDQNGFHDPPEYDPDNP